MASLSWREAMLPATQIKGLHDFQNAKYEVMQEDT